MKNLDIFVSSRISDDELKEEREIARGCIKLIKHHPLIGPFGAASKPPNKLSLEKVKECDIFVQILDKTITSIVKDEYDTAKRNDKPILIFVKKRRTSTF